MPKHIPERVDPWHLVERAQVIQGEIVLSSLGRLSVLLNDCEELQVADFRLSFLRDQSQRAIIHCEISATLGLTCQRCLGSMSMLVEIDSSLVLVQGLEDAKRLPEELEPLIPADDGRVRIRDLVEDELLLAIPDAPKHSGKACVPDIDGYAEDTDAKSIQAEPNPFEILAVLKGADRKR